MGAANGKVEETDAPMSKVWLEGVLEELRRTRGLDLGDYRRSTLERRLAARMADETNEFGAVSRRSPDRGGRDHENPKSMLRV